MPAYIVSYAYVPIYIIVFSFAYLLYTIPTVPNNGAVLVLDTPIIKYIFVKIHLV